MLSLNTWDVAVALTNYDWAIFDSVHEVRPSRTVRLQNTRALNGVLTLNVLLLWLQQELVYFTFSRDRSNGHTVALELLLQRCNEVQLWVMTEVLLCSSLCKRVQLIKKFIKIAAQSVALLTHLHFSMCIFHCGCCALEWWNSYTAVNVWIK